MGQSDPGAGSSAYPLAVLGGVGAIGAVSQNAAGELVTEISSFTKFRNRVDELLRDLKESPADAKKLGEDPIAPNQFGDTKWTEASVLYGSYQTVIAELENLSKLLSDSIEGMGIAVLASHRGYENLDEDVRHRMLAISDGVKEQYGGEYVPVPAAAKQSGAQPATAKPTPGATTGNI